MTGHPAVETPPARIGILLVDDDALVRAGLRLILGHAPGLEVVAEAGDGRAALAVVAAYPVDVALVDLRMPVLDGLGTLRELRARAPGVRVVLLTAIGDHEAAVRAVREGAAGFLLKDADPADIVHAIRAAAAGSSVFHPTVAAGLAGTDDSVTRRRRARELVHGLSTRERAVLVTVCAGMSNAQAARHLHLGEGTVKTHVSHILTKLRCTNRVQAAIIAYEAGLVSG